MHPLRIIPSFAFLALITLLVVSPAAAQQTTGSIAGRAVDQDGRPIPGVSITATNPSLGLVRMDTSDGDGVYRLAALPVGAYDVTASMAGFTTVDRRGLQVDVSRTLDLTITLRVAGVTETVTISAAAPLVSTSSSSLGEVVDLARIQSLPLNGRQFANLAALVPGVGIGFHADLTKATQFTPQIAGGNGRNVNFVVDGGDNNDDTVGGQLQLYPLEAIQEFNVLTHRFDAEYGRSNGGVINVVTRSGSNTMSGSWFTLLRDAKLNARTFTEQINNIPKQPYRRYQFGGSLGGPIAADRLHFFAAYERTQQDTRQAVNTLGLFPAEDGVYDTPTRQNLFSVKLSAVTGGAHFSTARYAHDNNSQLNGPGLRVAPSVWSTSRNTYHSLNLNDN